MQLKKNTLISGKNDNLSENFWHHEDEKSILKEQNIKGDYRNLVDKSSDTRSDIRDGLSGHTPQDRLLTSQLP